MFFIANTICKMSKIKHIATQLTDAHFDDIWQLYTTAFPCSERRELQQQKELLRVAQKYHCDGLFVDDDFLGLFFWWNFAELRFIEHFAILPQFRNKGLGEKVLCNEICYTQPPYRKGEKEVELLLLSYPSKLTDKELNYFYKECFPKIYSEW